MNQTNKIRAELGLLAGQIDAEITSWRRPWTGKGKDEYNRRVMELCGRTAGTLNGTIRELKPKLSDTDYEALRKEIEDNFFTLADRNML